jgi:uncharacterized FAD-dependent dehydrogenase
MVTDLILELRPEQAATENGIRQAVAKALHTPAEAISTVRIQKKSLDARGRNVKVRLAVTAYLGETPATPLLPAFDFKQVTNRPEVLIVGYGPAGMFAALKLLELGYRPVVLERGKDVRARRRDLAAINKQGVVNPDSNYCFGEGGAGTYSDGKLYTRSNKRGNLQRILQLFCLHGADENILYEAHPHIGTNKLPGIVQTVTQTIAAHGGQVLFESAVDDLLLSGGTLQGIRLRDGRVIKAQAAVICTGHSARDVFELLHAKKLLLEAKPFALGVRIEHPQALIDSLQYHCDVRGNYLPPAAYSLTAQAAGRGVFSFCMCPGGIIAPAATAPGELVVNGWSPSKRNNPYANSGMVVSVDERDFEPYAQHGPLAAMAYQAAVEQRAFAAGGGQLKAPAQRLVDFLHNKTSATLPPNSYVPGVTSVNLGEVLPAAVVASLRLGLESFGKKMKGYVCEEAVLLATESRTSSPVRIPRDASTLMHPQAAGLFPCGEGAGYAGGIISAAMDGERCAEAAVHYLQQLPTPAR